MEQTHDGTIELRPEDGTLAGMPGVSTGGGKPEADSDTLTAIIEMLNSTYGIHLTDEDQIEALGRIVRDAEDDEQLRAAMRHPSNSRSNKKAITDRAVELGIRDTLNRGQKTFRKLNDRNVKQAIKDYLFDRLIRKHVEGDESRLDLS